MTIFEKDNFDFLDKKTRPPGKPLSPIPHTDMKKICWKQSA